jgi:adenylate cyclase
VSAKRESQREGSRDSAPAITFAHSAEERTQREIGEWIVSATLGGTNEIGILAGIGQRLNAAGVPVVRISVATDLLDPTFDGRGVRWLRDEGGLEETFARDDEGTIVTVDFPRSPFGFLLRSGKPTLRRRLDATYERGEFSMLDRFQDQGITDYIAFSVRVGESMQIGGAGGMTGSWTTDAPGGFGDAQVEMLAGLMPLLTLSILLQTTHRDTRTLLTTYLGRHAADRVLAGNIVRGRAEPIRAVVWFSDLVGFTRISDNTSPEHVLALLNDYAQAQIEAIEAHAGHVLKFIGDGLLAIFPDDDSTKACARALDAAVKMRKQVAKLNVKRAAQDLPITDTHLALHLGELLYGNLGGPRRLDFTVLGSAVNEAARIEALCASLDQKVIVSWAFHEAAGDARNRLVSLGRYAMKGVARPQELFTLDPG